MTLLVDQQIDKRIERAYQASYKDIFTTFSPTDNNSVYNPDCWAADFDMTGISNYNDANPAKSGTLITPGHFLHAAHYPLAAGDVVTWIARDGTAVARTIGAVADGVAAEYGNAGDELAVAVLTADVPDSIKWYRILPSDFADYFGSSDTVLRPLGIDRPVAYFDQEEKVLIQDADDFGASQYTIYFDLPTDAARQNYYEGLIGGDSGHPSMIVIDGELVLLGCHWAALYSPFTTALKAPLNTLIAAADTAAGRSTGYTVTEYDLSTAACMDIRDSVHGVTGGFTGPMGLASSWQAGPDAWPGAPGDEAVLARPAAAAEVYPQIAGTDGSFRRPAETTSVLPRVD